MERFNEEKYRDAMDTVHAPTDLIEKTKGLVSGEHKFRNRRKLYGRLAVAMGTAAAVFCIVMTVPHTSFAQYAKNIFHGFWGDKREVSSSVQTGIFEDEDEHIKMSVEELLSDEMYVSVVIKYQAKDKKGKEWLRNDGMMVGVKTLERSLGISPKVPISGFGGEAGGELEEYRTDNVRYFMLDFEAAWWSSQSMGKCVIRYPLTEHVKETELDTSNTNIPVYEYALKAEGQKKLSRFYEPKILRMTKMTMGVYGKDTGMSMRDEDGKLMGAFSDEFLAAQEKKEELKSVQLIKKDGSYVPLDAGWGPGGVGKDIEDRYQCDCLVTTSSLYVEFVPAHDIYSGDRWLEPNYDIRINPEEITGLSISNGRRNVVYQLEKLK